MVVGAKKVRRELIEVRITEERDRLAAMPHHDFVAGSEKLCMTCGQVQLHPLHGVDPDGLPDEMLTVAPAVKAPSFQKAAYTGSGSMVALYPGSVEKLGVQVQGGSDFPVEDQQDWHITLAYLPETPEGDALQTLSELVSAVAGVQGPITGVWGGTARFNPSEGSDGKPVLVALPDLPVLPEFRHFLVAVLDAAGFQVAKNHGYTPHMTIAYDDNGRVRAEGPLKFTDLVLKTPDETYRFEFKGDQAERAAVLEQAAASAHAETAAVRVKCVDCGEEYFVDSKEEIEEHKKTHDAPDREQAKLTEAQQRSYDDETAKIKISAESSTAKGVHKFKAATWTHPNGHPRCRVCGQEQSISPECNREPTQAEKDAFDAKLELEFGPAKDRLVASVTEREAPAPVEEQLPVTRAFLTEVNGKTLLTGPAETFVPAWEKALTPNEHMLWLSGRFVGAEKANRNGAFWTTADLEMGAPTVNHGPLNWLHEARHVIGTIADSKLVVPTGETAADGFNEPHIVAAAAVWRWIFPDESYVLEQASDQRKLWYSMECVSKEVACMGDNGCGAVVPYMEAISNGPNVCTHVRERSSTRRFVDPTFLGGAVIVPPVRPGWADADMRVMREAASLAERAYEQAGQPDMTASQWEALMAEVVGFARA